MQNYTIKFLLPQVNEIYFYMKIVLLKTHEYFLAHNFVFSLLNYQNDFGATEKLLMNKWDFAMLRMR